MESNHASCEKIDAHIFEHLMNKRLLKFHLDVINSTTIIEAYLRNK